VFFEGTYSVSVNNIDQQTDIDVQIA